MTTLGIIGPPTDISGGPSSFRLAFEGALRHSPVKLVDEHALDHADTILVMGGTRRIATLVKARKRGAQVVLRLDGLPTSHLGSLPMSTRFVAVARRELIKYTLRHLATKVIFQSEYSRAAWTDNGFQGHIPSTVIHNGTNIGFFAPGQNDRADVIVSEGSVSGTFGGVELLMAVASRIRSQRPELRIHVFGRIEPRDRDVLSGNPSIQVYGPVARIELARRLQAAQAAIGIERLPACPNSVIEALASATPVVGHGLGAMPELVDDSCGMLVPFHGDPQLDAAADPDSIVSALLTVLENHVELGAAARARAEGQFDIRDTLARYVAFMSGSSRSTVN